MEALQCCSKKRLTLLTFLLLWVPTSLSGCLSYQTKKANFGLKKHQYVEVGPKRQRIRIFEQGNPANPHIVLIHGYASSGIIWLYLMKSLVAQGYHCIALDLPGFGHSDKYKGNYDTRHIANLVAMVMQKKGIKKADVIAHSWGSSVTLALALQHPQKVRRINIIGGWIYSNQLLPVLRWSKLPLVGELLYGAFFSQMPGEKYAMSFYDPDRMVDYRVVKKIHEALRRPGYLAAALAVARGMNFRKMEKRYRTIRHRTLLLWGKQDTVALPFYGQRLVSDLPNARLYLIDRCGHIPMLEQPHQVRQHVVAFLGPASRLKRR